MTSNPDKVIKNDISLSPRLDMLLELAGTGRCICDVGCDHGFLSIAAVLRGRFSRAIAVDINDGPLTSARKNCELYGVTDAVSLRISDGLFALLPGEADVILAAGMGGALIQRIISDGIGTALSADRLILSPQSEIANTRSFLLRSGFSIEDEDAVFDDGKYYFAMDVRHGGKGMYPCGEAGICFGGRLLEKRHPVLREYLQRQKDAKEQLLKRPEVAGSKNAAELKNELSLINEALVVYES